MQIRTRLPAPAAWHPHETLHYLLRPHFHASPQPPLSFLLSLALTLISSLFSRFFLLSLLSLRASTRTLRIMESWQMIQPFFFFLSLFFHLSSIICFLKKSCMYLTSFECDAILRFFPPSASVYWSFSFLCVCVPGAVWNGSRIVFIHLKREGSERDTCRSYFKMTWRPGMAILDHNPSTVDADTGGLLVQG